jgi:hypothetical protein
MEETPKFQPENEKVVVQLSMVEAIQKGTHWREALKAVGLTISRTSAYRYRKGYEAQGQVALQDGRAGTPL